MSALTRFFSKGALDVDEQDVTTMTNASGHVRFCKNGRICCVSYDITPSNASSIIELTIPQKYRLAQAAFYDQHTYNGNDIYIFSYSGVTYLRFAHTKQQEMIGSFTYITAN